MVQSMTCKTCSAVWQINNSSGPAITVVVPLSLDDTLPEERMRRMYGTANLIPSHTP